MSTRIMRVTAAPGLILLAALALPGPAFGQSFLGEWTATAHTPAGEISETLSITETDDGVAITAFLVGVPEGTPQAGPGTDVILDGDNFSYKRTIPGGELEITYTGVVSGDTFTGTAEMAGTEVPYTGVRIGVAD